MRQLVIFGTGDIAELAHYYFSTDSEYEVVAFVVDREYLVHESFCGLPVVLMEDLEKTYPPSAFALFVALSYSKLNRIRKEKFEAGLALGYKFASYVSSRATVLNEGRIGQNCFVLEDNTVQPFAQVGDNVTLWSGNHVGHHSCIGDHSFVASHVVISGGVKIGKQCFIGVNATIRDHIEIGDKCVIGAGVTLLRDAASDGVYVNASAERSNVPSSRLRDI